MKKNSKSITGLLILLSLLLIILSGMLYKLYNSTQTKENCIKNGGIYKKVKGYNFLKNENRMSEFTCVYPKNKFFDLKKLK